MKRYAAHYVFVPESGFLKQFVIVTDGGYVAALFPLTEEVESVEWLPGVLWIALESERLVLYHLYPFDFTEMKPVAETQRRLLP